MAKDSLSTPGKHINRQLEMTNTPLGSVSSAVISSKNQNLQKVGFSDDIVVLSKKVMQVNSELF